jgi:hypothetical protein
MKNSVRGAGGNARATGIFDRSKGLLLVLCSAVLPYLISLRYGFVYDDDVQVLANPAILDWHFVPAYFLKPIAGFYSGVHSAHYYRPMFFLWLRLNYFLFGPRRHPDSASNCGSNVAL